MKPLRRRNPMYGKKEKETYTEEEMAVMEEFGTNRPFKKTLKSKKQELR